MSDSPITDAVHDAFVTSFDIGGSDVVNPDRRAISPARFVLQPARMGWTVVGVEKAKLSLDAILEDADDEAFDEGEEYEDPDGNHAAYRNTWSGDAFVARCAANGITFEEAA